nr:AC5 protein [African cassava mosaic virus]
MSTCHVQKQCILCVILVLPCLLMIICHVMIQPVKPFHQRLLLHARWTTDNSGMKFPQNLKPIPQIVLNCCSTRLIIKHVKYLPKVLGRIAIRPSIPKQVKHHIIRVILLLNIFIHPDLTKNVNGLDTKPLSDSMCQPRPTCHITNHLTDTKVLHIIPLLKRLDLTWAFTAPRYVWASIHPVHHGLSVHGPVHPGPFSICDVDSGDSSTVPVWAVEVQPSTNLGAWRGNDDISWSLRHNYEP